MNPLQNPLSRRRSRVEVAFSLQLVKAYFPARHAGATPLGALASVGGPARWTGGKGGPVGGRLRDVAKTLDQWMLTHPERQELLKILEALKRDGRQTKMLELQDVNRRHHDAWLGGPGPVLRKLTPVRYEHVLAFIEVRRELSGLEAWYATAKEAVLRRFGWRGACFDGTKGLAIRTRNSRSLSWGGAELAGRAGASRPPVRLGGGRLHSWWRPGRGPPWAPSFGAKGHGRVLRLGEVVFGRRECALRHLRCRDGRRDVCRGHVLAWTARGDRVRRSNRPVAAAWPGLANRTVRAPGVVRWKHCLCELPRQHAATAAGAGRRFLLLALGRSREEAGARFPFRRQPHELAGTTGKLNRPQRRGHALHAVATRQPPGSPPAGRSTFSMQANTPKKSPRL